VAQRHCFLRTQRGVVQAPEERRQFRPDPADLGEDGAYLNETGHGLRVHRAVDDGCLPAHVAERVTGQQAEFDGVAEGVVEHRSFAGDSARRGLGAIEP
jgi:hypothetical protein